MENKTLEEKIYEFGQVMYRIGRMETDDKESTKEYNKFCKMREDLTKEFDSYFKTSKLDKKAAKAVGLF